jgi:tetratricopeptide (TPR) repeat protein
MKLVVLLGTLLLAGCALHAPQTDRLKRQPDRLTARSVIEEMPFIQQPKDHCGPATLNMVMLHLGKSISLDELTSQTFTPGAQGTYQSEMLSASRRQGLLAIPINDLKSLLQEVAAQNPVIVFQNLGFKIYPKWHYAVVVGHDLNGPDIILHSGDEAYKKMDMRWFERSWKLGGHWGLLVLPPGQLSLTAGQSEHEAAAAALEAIGQAEAARLAYQTLLKRWPHSLTAMIGLGNISYGEQDFSTSVAILKSATQLHPDSAIVWHNLAIAQVALGQIADAKLSAANAYRLADAEMRPRIQVGLQAWLP